MIDPHTPPPGAALRLLLTSREAAKALAVSERTLWQLRRDGKVAAVLVGWAVRYSVDDLRAYIDSQRAAEVGVN